MFVSQRAAQVSEVWLRAREVRTHLEGVVTTGNDRFPVDGGEVTFTAVPGPAVLALISQGRAVDTIPILVGDASTQTLRQVVSAAKVADDATKREIEKLAAQAVELVDSSVANAKKAQDGATRAETAAGNAKQSETNAEDAARRASNSSTSANRSSVWVSNAEKRAEQSASAAATSASSAKSDADRAANVANSTSWSGDKLTVNGKTSPSLTGPPGTTTWAGITDKPSTFPPEGHTHRVADISDMPTVSDAPINRTIVQRSEVGTIRAADPQGPNNVTTQKYVDTAVGAKADKSHKHTVTDISDLPAIDKSNKGSSLVQRWADGTISVPSNPGTSDNSATSKWYVDTAVATEKARTVGIVWMVETEAAAQAKESSCQKGDFIQVAQTGNIYQVV